MRDLDPTRHQHMVRRIDPQVSEETLLDRVDSRWAFLTVLPAYVFYQLAEEHFLRHATRFMRTPDTPLVGWSLVLLFACPIVCIGGFWLAKVALRALRSRRALRAHARAAAKVEGVGLVDIIDSRDGIVRFRGELHRAEDHDAFDARPPVFFVHDATGTATIDDDCLVLIGLGGALPPDGTVVEVAGPGRRADTGFVFDGSIDVPIAVRPVATPQPVPSAARELSNLRGRRPHRPRRARSQRARSMRG